MGSVICFVLGGAFLGIPNVALPFPILPAICIYPSRASTFQRCSKQVGKCRGVAGDGVVKSLFNNGMSRSAWPVVYVVRNGEPLEMTGRRKLGQSDGKYRHRASFLLTLNVEKNRDCVVRTQDRGILKPSPYRFDQ